MRHMHHRFWPILSAVVDNYRFFSRDTIKKRMCYLMDVDPNNAKVIDGDDFYLVYTTEDKYPVFAHQSEFPESSGIDKSAVTIHLKSLSYASMDEDDIVNDLILNELHEIAHWAAEHEKYPAMGDHPNGWNEVMEDVINYTRDPDYTWEQTGRSISLRTLIRHLIGV